MHGALERSPWPTAFGGRTRPEAWVPHCSLATRLDPATLARARAAVDTAHTPVEAVVSGLAVVLVGGPGDVGFVALGGAQPSSRHTQNG